MADLAPVAAKLSALIRMLSSDRDGEVVAAARAIVRTLKTAGADIHVLAERVEKVNGGSLSDVEMRKLYDAGFRDGIRTAENKQSDFHNIDGTSAWHEIARFCQNNSDRLQVKERTFIDDMTARSVWREPTDRQAKWLRSIFFKLGGKL